MADTSYMNISTNYIPKNDVNFSLKEQEKYSKSKNIAVLMMDAGKKMADLNQIQEIKDRDNQKFAMIYFSSINKLLLHKNNNTTDSITNISGSELNLIRFSIKHLLEYCTVLDSADGKDKNEIITIGKKFNIALTDLINIKSNCHKMWENVEELITKCNEQSNEINNLKSDIFILKNINSTLNLENNNNLLNNKNLKKNNIINNNNSINQ